MAKMDDMNNQTVESAETGVDQGALQDDFDGEILSQEGPLPKPASGKNEKPVVDKPIAAPVEKPAAAAAQPAEQPKASDLDEMVFGKDGFNHEKYTSFFNAKPNLGPITPPIDAPKPGETAAPAIKTPEEERRAYVEERRTYMSNMSNSLMAFGQFYAEARKQGLDENQAYARAESRVRDWLGDHMIERDFEMNAKLREQERKTETESSATARMQPMADANLATVAKEYGGMERLHKLLTHQELAGPYVALFFEQSNPGARFKSQAEYSKALDTWFVKVAQNPENVRRLAAIGYNAWQIKYMPQIAAGIKSGHDKALLESKRGRSNAPRTVISPDTNEKADALGEFFQNPSQRAESQEQRR
jgi:hypothetical protein